MTSTVCLASVDGSASFYAKNLALPDWALNSPRIHRIGKNDYNCFMEIMSWVSFCATKTEGSSNRGFLYSKKYNSIQINLRPTSDPPRNS